MSSSRPFPNENDQERDYNMSQQGNHHHHYYNPPMREIISPPPQYASPAPPEPPSPVSFSHEDRYATSNYREPTDVSRDPSPHRYTDRSPTRPPPPPAHRTSPSRHVQRHSDGRSMHGGAAIPLEGFVRPAQDNQPRSQAPPSSFERHVPQPIFPQQTHFHSGHSPISSPSLQRPDSRLHEQPSYGSNVPFAGNTETPGSVTPSGVSDWRSSHYSGRSIPMDDYPGAYSNRASRYSYHDSPYHNSSHKLDAAVSSASINPQTIADDADDDFAPIPRHKEQNTNAAPAAVVGAGVAKGGVFGGLLGRKMKNQVASGTYRPVSGTSEKGDWLSRETKKRKRNGWLCGIGIGVVILIIIGAGIVGGVVGTRQYRQGNGSINNANDDTAQNGDLNIDSAEIKQLLNNPDLHKVFPGMDYTPWGVQYPLCLTYPPSQNNVTRDVAVLSQLTNTIRLYGTDCNQTEMVLHAIDRLQLKNMKIWLGVWIDTNETTNSRQLSKMYNVLDTTQDKSIFKGAIVGNEALFRAGTDKATAKQHIMQVLRDVRTNFTKLGYSMPITTSDLGDNWDSDLVSVVDYVMSNIHPFFAGVSAEKAAAWTWNFWNEFNIPLTKNLPKVKHLISETGWPSSGGTDCGGTDGTCATGQSGAVASVTNMNTFMNDWVCQALTNGTEYFWFEAFDEAWKVQYNTPGKEWEDKWGLMDAGRNLKSGVKIPSCGGKTVS